MGKILGKYIFCGVGRKGKMTDGGAVTQRSIKRKEY